MHSHETAAEDRDGSNEQM